MEIDRIYWATAIGLNKLRKYCVEQATHLSSAGVPVTTRLSESEIAFHNRKMGEFVLPTSIRHGVFNVCPGECMTAVMVIGIATRIPLTVTLTDRSGKHLEKEQRRRIMDTLLKPLPDSYIDPILGVSNLMTVREAFAKFAASQMKPIAF